MYHFTFLYNSSVVVNRELSFKAKLSIYQLLNIPILRKSKPAAPPHPEESGNGNVPPGGGPVEDPGHVRGTMSLGWPGNTSVFNPEELEEVSGKGGGLCVSDYTAAPKTQEKAGMEWKNWLHLKKPFMASAVDLQTGNTSMCYTAHAFWVLYVMPIAPDKAQKIIKHYIQPHCLVY